MTNALKLEKKSLQKTRQKLILANAIDRKKRMITDETYAYIPLSKQINSKLLKEINGELVNRELPSVKRPQNLKETLKDKLTSDELNKLKTSFDIIGNIAILEIDQELKSKEKLIGETVLNLLKPVTTVLSKAGIHSGEFRTQKMKWIAGEKTKIAKVKENNVTIQLNVEEIYFSIRLSTERKRIMQLVNKDEDVLVLFSGCAPYPCVISKNTFANKIVGIELNPVGHEFGLKNIETNKLKNVFLYNDDAQNAGKYGTFDRILMPLPKSAEEFLDTALKAAKKGTIFHMYTFGSEEEMKERKKQVREICKNEGYLIKIDDTVKCGQFSPKVFRYCVDFRII